MRILTVRQPWAWSIIHGGKDVENRVRNIAGSYRGPVAIHVGLQFADAASPLNLEVARAIGETSRVGATHQRVVARIADEDLPGNHIAPWFGLRGAVIGVVNLWAVHEAGARCCPNRGSRPFGSPWAMADHWHLCLSDPQPLVNPVAATGKLGLWKPNDDLRGAILKQVRR